MIVRKLSRSLVFRLFMASLIGLSCIAGTAVSQDARGKIVGTVTDQQGAVIPDAKVVVTNTLTQIKNETVTDKEGNYQILALPIGTYQVSVQRSGFKMVVSDAQKLLINQVLRIDLSLQVGATSETVSVMADAGEIETVNHTDRKSTRLNSSHLGISYAVFCL